MATSVEEIVAQIDSRHLEAVIAQYARREVGLAKAASLLKLHVSEFQLVAAERGIDLAITPEDLADDVATLRRLGQLR
jgi:predicted HTH domain antitoxin